MIPWLTFVLCAAAIVVAGIRVAPYGEALGRHLKIGQGWIGLLFLATLTSIPEMTTTVTGASIGEPNIALGNAFGSNLFNVAIVALMDIMLLRRGPFLARVKSYHVISGGLAVLLTTLAVLGVVVRPSWAFLGISPISWLILLGYAGGVFLLFHAEKSVGEDETSSSGNVMSLARAATGFVLCGALVVIAGVFLIHASKEIAATTSLSASLVGAVLVAIVTSLPELATSIGALRIGAHDMIVGNLFGSNMFNILTIFFADAAFRGGSIFTGLSSGADDQVIVACGGMLLTVIAVIGIAVRSRRRLFGIGVDALAVLVTYIAATALVVSRGIEL